MSIATSNGSNSNGTKSRRNGKTVMTHQEEQHAPALDITIGQTTNEEQTQPMPATAPQQSSSAPAQQAPDVPNEPQGAPTPPVHRNDVPSITDASVVMQQRALWTKIFARDVDKTKNDIDRALEDGGDLQASINLGKKVTRQEKWELRRSQDINAFVTEFIGIRHQKPRPYSLLNFAAMFGMLPQAARNVILDRTDPIPLTTLFLVADTVIRHDGRDDTYAFRFDLGRSVAALVAEISNKGLTGTVAKTKADTLIQEAADRDPASAEGKEQRQADKAKRKQQLAALVARFVSGLDDLNATPKERLNYLRDAELIGDDADSFDMDDMDKHTAALVADRIIETDNADAAHVLVKRLTDFINGTPRRSAPSARPSLNGTNKPNHNPIPSSKVKNARQKRKRA